MNMLHVLIVKLLEFALSLFHLFAVRPHPFCLLLLFECFCCFIIICFAS